MSAYLPTMPALSASAFGGPSAEAIGEAFAEAAKAPNRAALRRLPPERILAVMGDTGFVTEGVVDGWVHHAQVFDVFAGGSQAKVPLMVGFTGDETRSSEAGDSFIAWLAPPQAEPAPVAIDPSWPFNIIYSSGTTGAPKGIVQSHAFRWGPIARAAVFNYSPETVTLVSTPLYSNTTLGPVLSTLGHGGALVLMKKFDARQFLQLAEQHRVTHAMLVPCSTAD